MHMEDLKVEKFFIAINNYVILCVNLYFFVAQPCIIFLHNKDSFIINLIHDTHWLIKMLILQIARLIWARCKNRHVKYKLYSCDFGFFILDPLLLWLDGLYNIGLGWLLHFVVVWMCQVYLTILMIIVSSSRN